MIRRPAARTLAVLLAVALSSAACSTEDLAFRQDQRLSIVSPGDREHVELPFELTWTVEDFEVGSEPLRDDGRYFAVFVDRSPLAPGQHIDSLASESCERAPDCPDAEWLADHFVHVTTGTEITIERLPADSQQNRTGARDLYEAVIVLMDGNDERIGESAFWVEFFHEGTR